MRLFIKIGNICQSMKIFRLHAHEAGGCPIMTLPLGFLMKDFSIALSALNALWS
jgi:hypothetical protein